MGQHELIETLAINVLAALLGMSLPLIMQIIDRLDSKYGSAVISSSFRREWVYRVYFYMVWITIAFVVLLPWAPEPIEYLKDSWFVCNSAHIIVNVSLGLTLISLFLVSWKITTYDQPEKLLKEKAGSPNPTPKDRETSDKKIKDLLNDPDKFAVFGSLIKYSMTVGNIPLYLNCNSIFGFCVGSYYSDAKAGEEVTFNDSIYNLLNETIRISQRFYDELLYPSLNSPYNVLSVYFASYGNSVISRKSFEQLWQNVIQLIGCNKPEWFKGYWVYAAQYADYTVSNRSEIPYQLRNYFFNRRRINSDELERLKDEYPKLEELEGYVVEKRKLCEIHHMFLAYLMYVDKLNLVDWCFEYSPSSLNTQLLLPKRLRDILDELYSIRNNLSGPIDFRYPFYQENGIRSSEIIENSLLRFYIYTLYKSNIKFNRGIIRIDPWENILLKGSTDTDKAHEINNLNYLIDLLRKTLFPNKEYFLRIDLKESDLKEINDNLINAQNLLNTKLLELQSNTEINRSDLNAANEIIKDAEKNGKISEGINLNPPINTEYNPTAKEEIKRDVVISMSDADYIWNTENIFQTMAPTLISQMNNIAQQFYLRIFLLTSPRYKFYINYDEIGIALKRLGILNNHDYAILPVGLVPPFEIEKLCEHPLMRGNRQEYLILKKNFLPSLYKSDVSDFKAEQSDHKIVFKGNVKFTYLYNEKLNYIRIIIVNSLVDGRISQLEQIDLIDL